jgi:hypothetical protein
MIPPVAPAAIIFELDCSHALGINRYTLAAEEFTMNVFSRSRRLQLGASSLPLRH